MSWHWYLAYLEMPKRFVQWIIEDYGGLQYTNIPIIGIIIYIHIHIYIYDVIINYHTKPQSDPCITSRIGSMRAFSPWKKPGTLRSLGGSELADEARPGAKKPFFSGENDERT